MVPTLSLCCLVLASCSSGGRTAPAEQGAIRAEPAEQPAIRWDAPIEIARGGGQLGEWRQNDSDYNYVDDTTVALADDGTAVVAWVDQARKEIFVQRYSRSGTATAAPVAVSRTPAVFSWLPRLVLDGNDIYVLWQEIVFSGGSHGGEAFFARSRDGGATFDAPQNLSRSRNGDGKGRISKKVWHNGSLDLTVAKDGTIYAAWTEFDGPLWVSRSRDRGATFTSPVRIDDRSRPARAPALATWGDTVYVAWSVGEDSAGDVRLSVSTDGETFERPTIVARTPRYSDAPKLVVDAAGTLHLAWSESLGGPRERATVRYMRSRDRGRTFEPPREIAPAGAGFPMLAVDGERVVVSWERMIGSQPRGLSLAYSLDRGSSFSRPVLVPGSIDPGGGVNGSHQGRLMEKLAARDGQLAIANSALAHGRSSRVWFVRATLRDITGPRATASRH